MNSKSDSDSATKTVTATGHPTEKELAAYNEAGHAIAGIVQGRVIEYILIRQAEGIWGGKTRQDFDCCPLMLPELPPHIIYSRIDYPYPQGGHVFNRAEKCILKFAGVVAEELLCEHRGINPNEVRIGTMDVIEAEGLAKALFPDDPQKQYTLLHNAKSLAYNILSDSTCWYAVEILAKAIIEEHAKEPVMNGERAHEIINQVFAQQDYRSENQTS